MAIHATLPPTTALILRSSVTSNTRQDIVIWASDSIPTSGTTPAGSLESGQPSICVYRAATNAQDLLWFSDDGGTTWTRALGSIETTVANNSGGPFAAGDVVYLASYDSAAGVPEILLSDADAVAKPGQYMLLEDIANGATGRAAKVGTVSNIDTSGWAEDTILYLSGTATTGNTLTDTAPSATGSQQQVVGVVEVSNATTGRIRFDLAGDEVVRQLASRILVADAGSCITATDVEAALQEVFLLARGFMYVGDATGVLSRLDLGAAQGIPYSDGNDILRGTIQDHGASTSTLVATGVTVANSTDATGATVANSTDVTGATVANSTDVTGVTASGAATGSTAASVTVGGTTDSGTASVSVGGTTDSGTASVSVGGTTDSGTASLGGSTASGTANLAMAIAARCAGAIVDPPAANTTAVHAAYGADQVNDFPGAFTNPTTPRNLTVTFSGAWDGGNVTVTGTNQWDDPDSEEFVVAVGTTVAGVKIFKTSTAAAKTAVGTAGQTASIGTGGKLGLTDAWAEGTLQAGSAVVFVDGVAELATYDATNEGFTPTSVPDASRDYVALVNYAPPLTDSGHSHGVGTLADSGHSHGSTALTATDSGHSHGSTALTATDAGHTHGSTALTATDAGHTHTAGAITVTDAGHTHTATVTDAGHTHTATVTDAGHTHTATVTDPTHQHSTTPPAHSIA